MKKIISNLTNVVSLNSINNDDLIIGIRDGSNINVVARVGMNRYALVSIQDYNIWSWNDKFSLIRDLVKFYWKDFDFYQLDSWKEIKHFIK